MKEIAAECKPFKKSHICRIDTFLEDAQAKVLSPKRYVSWLQKKVDSTRGGFYRKQYMEKMVRFLDKIGKRDEAIAVMEAIKNRDDELRLLFVDMLTEWRMYDEALQVADVEGDIHADIYSYPTKTLHILDLINDREKTIAVCKARFVKTDRKQTYFNRLRQEMTKEEWESFIDGTIQNADDVFLHDYDDVEAHIYMERKLYDHLVKFCLHTSYDAENNLENYAKYMSEADQRLVAQDIIELIVIQILCTFAPAITYGCVSDSLNLGLNPSEEYFELPERKEIAIEYDIPLFVSVRDSMMYELLGWRRNVAHLHCEIEERSSKDGVEWKKIACLVCRLAHAA